MTRLLIFFLFVAPAMFAQNTIRENILQQAVEAHIYFLASDELKGRDTGTPELEIAARYIATQWSTAGATPLPGQDDFFHRVPFIKTTALRQATFHVGDSTFHLVKHLVSVGKGRGEVNAPLLFTETLEGLSAEESAGKIILTPLTIQGGLQNTFASSAQRVETLKKLGASGLIELYANGSIPWFRLASFLNRDQLVLAQEGDEQNQSAEEQAPEIFLHAWMGAIGEEGIAFLKEQTGHEARLHLDGDAPEKIKSDNVLAYIEGTDPKLKSEAILLSAHYDHVGVVVGQTQGDYIFNGARDNGIGTAAILEAGRYFAKNPSKRSIILAAWTAEEKGLLGSRYYAENPTFPLKNIVYNLNIDGGGYNDTTKVTVIGLGRTHADSLLKQAAQTFGLEAVPDPVPEQNLFDRSDNVAFAAKGIPAPTYSTGITAFDEEITRYYHQVTDNPNTVDYPYLTRYVRSYVWAARAIANAETAPFWNHGDKYEEAGKALYGKE